MVQTVWCDRPCLLGEGPVWNDADQCLYWVDIMKGELLRSADGQLVDVLVKGPAIGGFTFQRDGSILLFRAKGEISRWFKGELTTVIDGIEGEEGSRFNDVIAAPDGGVYCGTMPSADSLGSLYYLDTRGQLTRLFGEVGCSNGMGFSPNLDRFYFTDTSKRAIFAYTYGSSGTGISDRKQWFATNDDGHPDGMTVDSQGCVWTALWDGGCVLRLSPEGEQIGRYLFEAKRTTCPTFGGPDYAKLFVTSAGGNERPGQGVHAGATFILDAGVCGRPEFRSAVLC